MCRRNASARSSKARKSSSDLRKVLQRLRAERMKTRSPKLARRLLDLAWIRLIQRYRACETPDNTFDVLRADSLRCSLNICQDLRSDLLAR